MNTRPWFEADNIIDYDSPALLLYPSRIKENIRKLLEKVDVRYLRPHVKTNKIAEVSRLMLEAGIKKFKVATIAEAEMLALIKAPDVLLAYPPAVPKINRLIRLIQKYPDTHFSCLVDHAETAQAISHLFAAANLEADIYIDLNLGMNRTGIQPGNAIKLFEKIISLPAMHVLGLHVYDGHIKDRDLRMRTDNCIRAFEPVLILQRELEKMSGGPMTLIAGGSPTCFIHAAAGARECSPGTFIFWDKGYSENLPEQPFDWAAILLCRVISIPSPDMVCVDLGYKSVASENPLPRVYFLNAPEAVPVAHSEEHLVLKVPDAGQFKPGDVLYGVPMHICPTVALYDKAYTVENNQVTGFWEVIARKREITI
jgi:D-serine deaminase-like pyridoxal phosphate-dependent protein